MKTEVMANGAHPSDTIPVDPTDRPLPRGKLLISLLILLICADYVAVTLLYVLPSNPLRIHFDEPMSSFEKWGYQKWTFFAPPPQSCDRLYFAFSPRVGEGQTFEVLEGIYTRKRKDNPQNTKTQVVDYTVGGTATAISDGIREILRYRKVHDVMGGDPQFLDDVAKSGLDPTSPFGGHMRVLLRYAAMVAAQHGIETEGLKCQIAFTHLPLRPFMQRYNRDYPIEETMIYKTTILDVPRLARR